jgi:hypothetical protein
MCDPFGVPRLRRPDRLIGKSQAQSRTDAYIARRRGLICPRALLRQCPDERGSDEALPSGSRLVPRAPHIVEESKRQASC